MIGKAAGLKLVKANKTFREKLKYQELLHRRNTRSLPLMSKEREAE